MKAFWLLLAALLLAGAWILLAPDRTDEPAMLESVNTVGRSQSIPLRASPTESTRNGSATPAANDTTRDEPTAPSGGVDAAPTAAAPDAPPPPLEGSLALGLDARISNATVQAGMLKVDGDEVIADGSYIIRGAGTKERPYEVSWELLQSCQNTYVPRLGEKAIPQRISMLHGKWVTIAGYIAFPIVSTESSELLAMLNQWDGCCIGVPPSPYDAVEVKLAAPVEVGLRHQIRFSSITGVFTVQPYVMERWLVGLYLLDDATLDQDM